MCSKRKLTRGQSLFLQGDQMHELFILLSGRVRVYYISEKGNKLTFAYWTAGTLVGTPALYRDFLHLWNADAVEPTVLMVVRRAEFVRLLQSMPSLSMGVIEALEFKAKRLSNLSQILATSSVPVRLQLLLLNLADLYGIAEGDSIILSVPFTHEEISGMVSASRPWVSSMISLLRQHGILDYNGRLMAFASIERLRRCDFDQLMKSEIAKKQG